MFGFAFWEILVGVVLTALVGFVISRYFTSKTQKEEAKSQNKSKTEKSKAKKTIPKEPKKFTREEVEKHKDRDDCWLIIDNKVYDVTAYVDEHRGGDAILNNAGGENSEGFHGPQHPSYVVETVKEFYIGDIVD